MPAIDLTNGGQTFVDREWYERLAGFSWVRLTSQKSKTSYAARGVQTSDGRRLILMHREIKSPLPTEEVDHWDDDGLNNREDNLRIASSSLNKVSRKRRVGLSGFKGVSEHRSTPGRFQAIITIGTFSTAETAARSYDELAVLLWGEDARLNFPNSYDAKERGN